MNSKILISAVVLLVVLGAGAYLLTKNSTTSTPVPVATPTPTTAAVMDTTPTASPSVTMMKASGTPTPSTVMTKEKETGSVKTYTVTGSSFKFAPSTITVKKGDTVKITFTNSGGTHSFVIDAFNVTTKVLSSGQSETVSFTASKAGTYEYYCSVGNHRQMGMVGKLIVE